MPKNITEVINERKWKATKNGCLYFIFDLLRKLYTSRQRREENMFFGPDIPTIVF